jgi:hypothetical protein
MRPLLVPILLVFWILTTPVDVSADAIAVLPIGEGGCLLNFDDSSLAHSCSANNGALGYTGYAYTQASLASGLHAESESTFAGMGGFGGQAGADATISDTATLQGAPASGSLAFVFAVDGTLSLTTSLNNGNDHADEFMSVSVDGTIFDSTILYSAAAQMVSATETVNASYSGSVFNLILALNTTADCTNGGTIACSAVADFSDTSRILGVEVLDSNGNIVPGATLTSSTGFVYPEVSSVPEPSSLILLSTALLGAYLLMRTLAKTKPAKRSRAFPFISKTGRHNQLSRDFGV